MQTYKKIKQQKQLFKEADRIMDLTNNVFN